MSLRQEHEQLIQQLYRLLKLGNMHDVHNQAVQRSVEQALALFQASIQNNDGELIFLFVGAHIFINGQPLNASRQVYEQARELAQLFEQMKTNEIVMDPQVSQQTLTMLVNYANAAQNSPTPLSIPQMPHGCRLSHIKASLLVGLDDEEEITPHDKVIRICTSTLVVMDRLYERTRQGDYSLVRHVKRLARDLVLLAEEHPGSLLSFLNTSSNRVDPAMFSVKGAILAVLTAQKLTRDLRNLADLAMTALLFDSGTIRACGMLNHAKKRGLEFMPKLSDDAADRQPVATATMMAMFGQLNEASLSRSIYSYESHFIQRRHTLGFPYKGQLAPTIEALIIAVVRRFLRLTALDLQREDAEYTVDEAIETLFEEAHSKLEQIILQLFLITLGLFRPGSAVVLSSGAKAIVFSNHEKFTQFTRPKILLAYGNSGQRFDPPSSVDLSHHHPEILSLGRIKGPLNELDDYLLQTQQQVRRQTIAPQPHEDVQPVPLAQLAGEVPKPGLPQAPKIQPRRPAHMPGTLPSTAHEIEIPQSLQENSIWQVPTPVQEDAEDGTPMYTISLTEIQALSEARDSEPNEAPVLPMIEPMPLDEPLDTSVETPQVHEALIEVPIEAPVAPTDAPDDVLIADKIKDLPTGSITSMTDNIDPSQPAASPAGMVNVNDLLHLFPASFSELDASPERQSFLDPTEDTNITQSPQTWDSTLDDVPTNHSDMGVLKAEDIEEQLPDPLEATTLLPRDVIATFQFYDQSRKQHEDSQATEDPASNHDN